MRHARSQNLRSPKNRPLHFPLHCPKILPIFQRKKLKVSPTKSTKRRRSDSNRCIKVLQTSPLPLGYGATENLLIISAVEPRIAEIARIRPAENHADCFFVGS